jgi:hypothetical protein
MVEEDIRPVAKSMSTIKDLKFGYDVEKSVDMKKEVGGANFEIAETLKSLEANVFSKPKFDF